MTPFEPYQATLRADLVAIYEKLRPHTVGCFNLGDVSAIPLEAFVRGGSHVWFVDGWAGRVQSLLAEGLVRQVGGRRVCLACDPTLSGVDLCAAYVARATPAGPSCQGLPASARDPARCAQYVPGRKLQIINGDTGRGRGAGFATRVETVVASAATPGDAVEGALAICQRSAQMNIPLPLEDGSLDLAVSVFAPARLMEEPYSYFDGLMTRRFRGWAESSRLKLARKLDELRVALFRTQLDAHVRELARLAHPHRGSVYFATMPVEGTANGTWSLECGVTEFIEVLARSFVFDFDTVPAEAFLRRPCADRSIVIQAALVRRKPREGGR